MEKLLDKLLVEFLVPALLMLICIVLAIDIIQIIIGEEDYKLIYKLIHFNLNLTLKKSFFLILAVIGSYIVNTSLSSLFNLILRSAIWGDIRGYLIYRKLNVFKDEPFKKENMFWLKYLYLLKSKKNCFWSGKNIEKEINIEEKIKEVIIEEDCLYKKLQESLEGMGVPKKAREEIVDLYDVVRTVVMASKDNAVVEWIQYHWSHLRLARSTLVPAFMLIFLGPFDMWKRDIQLNYILIVIVSLMAFFLIQFSHYYYRERFMIYAILGYFFTLRCKCDEEPNC